jgi:hypothetical protein
MKHIKLFEDFKQKNITTDDVIECINNGGVLYATIIKNFPDNDPEIPLNPVSVDNEGTVTVELDGKNYEVELRHIDKIEWR